MAWTLILLGTLVAAVLLWLDTMQSRERARTRAAAVCQSEGWQLLDQTVALAGLKPARNRAGQLRLARRWRFEFSERGNDRRRGEIMLLGDQMLRSVLESSEGRIIESNVSEG